MITRMIVLTPDMHAPTWLLEFWRGSGWYGELVYVARGRSPSFKKILGAVTRPVARLSPIGDEFAWHLERIAIVQTDLLLATERTALALVSLARTCRRRSGIVLRIIDRILYTTRAAVHDGLLLTLSCHTCRVASRRDAAAYISREVSPTENNQFHRPERSPGRSILRPRRSVAVAPESPDYNPV